MSERWMRAPVYQGEYSAADRIGILVRLLVKGILPGGPRRWAAFLTTLPLLSPTKLPTAIADWITGLSMRSSVERRFGGEPDAPSTVERRVSAVHRAVAGYPTPGVA